MYSDIAQLLTMASAINGVISREQDISEKLHTCSGFEFCKSTKCIAWLPRWGRGFKEVDLYGNPSEWFQSIIHGQFNGAWLIYASSDNPHTLSYMPPEMLGRRSGWLLIVSGERVTEVWKNRSETISDARTDNRPYEIFFVRMLKSFHSETCPQPDLETTRSQLRQALVDIKQFAEDQKVTDWCTYFDKGIDCLTTPEFKQVINQICIPFIEHYPETAQRLLSTAYSSWVFGGMGWWNDMWFDNKDIQKQYQLLSGKLHSCLNQAIQQATWAFDATCPERHTRY